MTKKDTVDIHPYANLFPQIENGEFDDLVADIKKNGLISPIVLASDGRIADGKNRYRACVEAGVTPRYEHWKGTPEDLLDHVIAMNVKRRHLTESQRSMVAAKLVTTVQGRQPTKPQTGQVAGLSQEQASRQMSVGERTVRRAQKVLTAGVKSLQTAVTQGKITAAGGAVVSLLSKVEQREVVTRVLDGAARNAKVAMKQLRTEKQIKAIENSEANKVEGSYSVVVVDPPWRYEKRREDTTQRGKVTYPDMTEAEIAGLKIPGKDDSILFLWTTNAHLVTGESPRVAHAWGYTPKTLLTWRKPRMGVGDWARGQTEHCIVAVKGDYKLKSVPSTIFDAKTGKHSQKPDEFYSIVEKCCPGSKCELFARKKRKGWEQDGSELGSIE